MHHDDHFLFCHTLDLDKAGAMMMDPPNLSVIASHFTYAICLSASGSLLGSDFVIFRPAGSAMP